jgi:hypothetical protein
MARIEDHDLIAYVDGELDAAGQARVEAALEGDPELAARLEAHMRLRTLAAGAFADVLEEPPPERLLAQIRAGSPAPSRRAFPAAPWAALAAACLVVGVFAGRLSEPSPIVAGEPAPGHLARALDDELSGGTGVVRIGLSFQSADGFCRTFVSREARLSGLACRADGDWRVRLTEGAQDVPGDYRLAGAASPAVLAAVDRLIVGQPLDRVQEQAARRAGWR